jgi:hypothetical protein
LGEFFGRKLGRPRRESIVLKWILEKSDEVVWIGFISFRIGTSGGGALLNTVMNFGFHKILENSSVAEQLAASQE